MAWLHAQYLWMLWLIPLAIALFLLAMWRRRTLSERFGHMPLVRRLSQSISGRRRRYKAAITVAGLALLILSLAGPQVGTRLREVNREGIDLVIALDVSLSMMAEDVAPNRLGRARNEIKKLLTELRGDRIGLVIFAGDAFVQCPLTTDYSAVRLFLDVANPDLLPTPGTNFEAALDMALQAFDAPDGNPDPNAARSRALLIVSDGENHEANVDEVLARARAEDVAIFSAGVGEVTGGPIPMFDNGRPAGYKRDLAGAIVQTRLEEEALKQLASDGAYFQIARTSSSLQQLIPALDRLDKTSFASEEFEDYDLKYQWPLAVAVLLLWGEQLLPVRRKRDDKS